MDKVGLLFALKEEEAGFERVMSESRNYARSYGWMTRWPLGAVQVAVAVSGVGMRRAGETTQRLIDYGVTCVICAGLAAGLDPAAQIGDVFVADTIGRHPNDTHPPLYSHPVLMSLIPPDQGKSFQIRRCSLVTSERPIIDASQKLDIFRATGAAVLDMESYAAAKVCAIRGVPFVALRSVSDRADQSIPKQVVRLLAMQDSCSRALFAIAKPALWPPLMRLHRQAGLASSTLGDTIGMMLLRAI